MTQEALFLLLVFVTGIYALRWTLRLAPFTSELPFKTLIATVLAGLALLAGLPSLRISDTLRWVALLGSPLYVFAPLALVALARGGGYRLARLLLAALYWTDAGREALRRLLAQVALQQGRADTALELIPNDDPLMLAQAYALQGAWREVLALELPREGDNAFLGEAARVRALLELGELDRAERELDILRDRFEAGRQGPIGFRSLQLSEARVAAERGDLERARRALQQPMTGAPAHELFAILARAAARGGRPAAAGELYARAYAAAPPGVRDGYRARLDALEQPLPEVERPHRPWGTYGALLALALAYGLQLWLDAGFGRVSTIAGPMNTSTAVAGFLLNVPGVPAADAWWRFLSYGLVHANLLHIGTNAWVLFDIGRIYEARRGWGNVMAALVAGTAAGAAVTVLLQGEQTLALVGASGGVLGVAGALLSDAMRSATAADRLLTRSLLQWMALIVLLSVAIPNVSLWGHVGGVLGGMLWGLLRHALPLGGGARSFDRAFDRGVGLVSLALVGATVASVAQLVARALF